MASSRAASKVSLADLIVLGGCAAVEQAAKDAGHKITGALHPGPHRRLPGTDRRDSFAVLEPAADGFRNYSRKQRQSARRVC